MRAWFSKVAVAAVAATALASTARANLVTNGDFSAGQTPWSFTGNVTTFTSADYDACCATGNTGTGRFAAFGGGDGPDDGRIVQTIPTVAGMDYALTFQYGAFSSPAGRGTQSLAVSAGNLATTITSAPSVRDQTSLFTTYSLSFRANGPATTLTFADASTMTTGIDGLLDTVEVTNMPEPLSLALIGSGLAGLGLARSRKSRTTLPTVSQ